MGKDGVMDCTATPMVVQSPGITMNAKLLQLNLVLQTQPHHQAASTMGSFIPMVRALVKEMMEKDGVMGCIVIMGVT